MHNLHLSTDHFLLEPWRKEAVMGHAHWCVVSKSTFELHHDIKRICVYCKMQQDSHQDSPWGHLLITTKGGELFELTLIWAGRRVQRKRTLRQLEWFQYMAHPSPLLNKYLYTRLWNKLFFSFMSYTLSQSCRQYYSTVNQWQPTNPNPSSRLTSVATQLNWWHCWPQSRK